MEQKLSLQHEAHTEAISKKIEVVNKKIEKQQKTINNILDTLNELSGPEKRDKTAATLSSCKSATKLKNFFGFGWFNHTTYLLVNFIRRCLSEILIS